MSVMEDFLMDFSRNDVKPVSIVAIGCLHPVLKVQSASIHFFLGDDDQKDASDDEEEEVCFTLQSVKFILKFLSRT